MVNVAILGGGVAGMSVAHELRRRSTADTPYNINVYEKNPIRTGGKARTIPVPDSGTDGRSDLPGEHGFRFFPGFYKHLPNTMEHIPYGDGSNTFKNLVIATRLDIARFDEEPIVVASRFPKSLSDLITDLEAMFVNTGLEPGELKFFAERLWQVITSCQERRLAEYEKITWWDYLEADTHSEAFRRLLVAGLSRSLLANDPRYASLRTVGDTNIQLMLGIVEPDKPVDRLLNGPTSKVWIDPWYEYLQAKPEVQFHLGWSAEQIQFDGNEVCSVTIQNDADVKNIEADIYVFCLPVERMKDLLIASGEDAISLDPAFPNIIKLANNVRWMNGIQFFLYDDVPITHGHNLFADSPWALTGISEAQFWSQEHLPNTGDGTVNGVLSCCISEWNVDGIVHGLPANKCTPDQIADEVWAQVQKSVNVCGRDILKIENRHSWFLDPDITVHPDGDGVKLEDAEPLFVNFTNSWALRPKASLGISNMFLASDYVQTYTDVACMEAANEAARRAVNGILEITDSPASPCELWKLHEPDILAPFRWHDEKRFKKGLPWNGKIL